MAAEKLFYEDVYCKNFRAKVLSCTPGKHGFDVVLDRTAFYPRAAVSREIPAACPASA